MNTQPGGYVRPEIPEQVFLDDAGVPIPYGNRWEFSVGPPEDAYSNTAHPERFAPVQAVARALIDHLVSTYDVEQRDDFDTVHHRILRARGDLTDAVTLVPSDPRSAPLSFLFTDHPTTTVLAGAYSEERFPGCGCDACDDRVEYLAEDLEDTVFDVVNGDFREHVERLFSPMIWAERSHGRTGTLISMRQAVHRRRRLRPVRDGWQPWPLRSAL